VSFGASVIEPFASIETPRESPLRTSARDPTVQTEGSVARIVEEMRQTIAKAIKMVFIF
jgi:hypothetical protein